MCIKLYKVLIHRFPHLITFWYGSASSRSRIRPDARSHVLHELQLFLHVRRREQVTFFVRRESALGRDTDPLQCFVYGLPRTARHDPCSFKHTFPQLFLVFQLWEFTRDQTQHDRFVLRTVFQRVERACNARQQLESRKKGLGLGKRTSARGVIFEVVTVDIQGVEQLYRDRIIPPFREMDRVPKVSSAEV